MLTRISLALFTSATFHLGHSTSPGGREHGHVPEELGRHWEQARGRAAAQRRVLPGIPYQTLRKELVNKKMLQQGEASKESLQECFCHRQQLNYHVLSTDSSPGWELSMTCAGQSIGEWWVKSQTQGTGNCVWFAVGWGMTWAKRAQWHMGMEQLQERILHSSKLATGLNAFRDFFPVVLDLQDSIN